MELHPMDRKKQVKLHWHILLTLQRHSVSSVVFLRWCPWLYAYIGWNSFCLKTHGLEIDVKLVRKYADPVSVTLNLNCKFCCVCYQVYSNTNSLSICLFLSGGKLQIFYYVRSWLSRGTKVANVKHWVTLSSTIDCILLTFMAFIGIHNFWTL